MRGFLGIVLGIVARVWLWTLRMRVVIDPALMAADDRAWVLSFFHGTQWPLLGWKRRRPTVVLVSLSRDGAMQARALRRLGMRVVRGSSSRGGVRGLAALVRVMKREKVDAAFAVDGPKGPIGIAKSGAIVAANASNGILVPMGSAMERGIILAKAWDRFALAWPFSRVIVTLGAPIDPSSPDAREVLEAAILRANDVAARALAAS